MAKDDFDIEEDEDGNKTVTIPADQATNMRELARQAQANADAVERAAVAERKLAFLEAGIPNTPLGTMFAKAYEGELTEDAIKVAAAAIPGLLDTPAAPAPTAEELEAQRLEAEQTGARGDLSRGAVGDAPPPPVTGVAAANAVMQEYADKGVRLEVAQGMGIAALATQALNGDKSVLVQPRAEIPA